MPYLLDLFTPTTWKAFREHGSDVTGFARAHRSRAANLVKTGDIFICYVVKLSRWCGALEVVSTFYEDESPIFQAENDPWVIRFKVKPLVVLDEEHAIPIKLDRIWKAFSRTRELEPNAPRWAASAALQSSLIRMSEEDGDFLFHELTEQAKQLTKFPLTEVERQVIEMTSDTVKTPTGAVAVVIPDEEDVALDSEEAVVEQRESIEIQTLLCSLGCEMGYKAWVPRSDRGRVSANLDKKYQADMLAVLPINFPPATFKTIENIDVIWFRKGTIVRAFEVEQTTAIYSGLLRMADLLQLQPNIEIKLHIVAPASRREKVFAEIQRPVFSLLGKGPLAESCSYISYDALRELSRQKHLDHMNDSILEEYEEIVEQH